MQLPFALMLALAILGLALSPGSAKTCHTFTTDEELAIARENIAKYDWAKKILSDLKSTPIRSSWCDIGKSADQLLEVPDEQLWELMPDTRIHREYYVNQHKGCPIHGLAIKKYSVFHPWKIDPFNKPFKIQCPVGGEWYPSNDFANGDLTSGDFPDDGTGCKRAGDTYYFLGEYIHAVYLNGVRPALDRLSELYLLTGDRRYARKAAILLLRLAEQFPNSTDKKDRCYKYAYAANSGLITDYIWSCGDVSGIAHDYDSLYDALDDPEILAFASTKIPAVKTGADFRAYVEKNILQVGAQALIDKAIIGNQGMHQATAATLALVLDDVQGKSPIDSRALMDWLYDKSSGSLRTFARNMMLKDGGSSESPGYNTSRLAMLPIMDTIEKLRARHPGDFPTSRYPSLMDEPKIRAMADYFTDLVILDRYNPGIGDSGGEPLKPGDRPRGNKSMLGSYAELYLRHTGEDRFAAMLMDTAGQIRHWSLYKKPLDDRIREAVARLGHFPKRDSTLLDGYGLVIARSGADEDQRAAWLYYGASRYHVHRDYLNLGLDAKGMALIPELGYPKSWDFAQTWESNILTHNTVCIDRRNPTSIHDYGRLVAFQSVPGIELMDAQQDPYRTPADPFGEPERLYRRTSLLVDLSPEDCYVADIFRVRGGKEHWQSWHGPAVPAKEEGPAMVPQPKGTLAGEEWEYNTERPGPGGKPFRDPLVMLNHVARGKPEGPWSLDYDCGGSRQVHIRITGLPEPGTELVTADGRAPSEPDDYTIRFAFACRQGDAPLESQFLTVLEPYAGKRVVDRVERLEPAGKALKGYRPAGIRVAAGELEDTILSTGTAVGTARLGKEIALKGDTGLARRRNGRTDRLFLSTGTYLSAGDCALTLSRAGIPGTILSADRKANEIEVAMQHSNPSALVGRRVKIHNESRSVAYTILAAESAGLGRVRLKLNTTSLLAEGVASGFEDDLIVNKVQMGYAGMTLVDGQWQNACSTYVGATLENEAGNVNLRIAGVHTGDTPSVQLDPKNPRTAAELGKLFTDTDGDGRAVFHLYDYGPGDQVTIPNLASLRATGEGYSLEATDDVTVSLEGHAIPARAGRTNLQATR